MDQQAFEEVLKEYRSELESCEKSAKYNQRMYRVLQWSVIVLSIVVSILAALAQKLPGNLLVTSLAVTIPIIVSGLAAILTTFNYKERWAVYGQKYIEYKGEYFLYKAGRGDYANETDREGRFAENFDKIRREQKETLKYLSQR